VYETDEVILEAGRTQGQYWKDLWKFRELFLFLAWRDLLVRYKQTVIGVAWSVIRPFLTMVVFTIVFGKLARFPSEGVPYPILVFAAMLPWQMFSHAVNESSNSLIANAGMLSKVYFPRMVLPASAVLVSLADFLISFAVLAVIMAWYQFIPSWRIVTLPIFLFLALTLSLGFGTWLASLTVKYRDFRYIVSFLLQFGLYISPVGFSSSVIPDRWRLLYSLNPMVGVIDGFRWAIMGSDFPFYLPGFLLSIGLTSGVLYFGLAYFRKTERTFTDLI